MDQPSRSTLKPERRTTPSRASATSRSTRGTSTPTRSPRHLRALPAMKTVSTLLGFIRLTTAPGALLSGQTLSRSALSSTMSASLPGVSVPTLRSRPVQFDGGEFEHIATGEQRRQVLGAGACPLQHAEALQREGGAHHREGVLRHCHVDV